MNLKDRQLVLSSDVTEYSVGNLIKRIRDINCDDDDKEMKEVGYIREPIQLIVNSFGGSSYGGFGLIAAIETSKTPVYTYCFGSAMSMGFVIFLAGQKRFTHSLSTFMYHQVSCWNWGKLEDQKRTVAEMERLQEMYIGYVLKKTKILKERLEQVNKELADWYINADEAIKLGIADEIV